MTRCGRHDTVPFAQSFAKLQRGAQRQFEAQSNRLNPNRVASLPQLTDSRGSRR
jgi:hypothetical protein